MNNNKEETINDKRAKIFAFNEHKNVNDYSLRDFLSILEDKNELLVINKKVNKKFQLASIVGKLDKKEAILFTNVEGSKFKVVS
ncbi:MAG TPA: hypothetical protein VGC75_01210, partial [Candidatus Nitrosocosmicus sp.]